MKPSIGDAAIEDTTYADASRSRRRRRGILTGALTGFVGKGTSLVVSAITVPLTVRYLGSEGYGLWITITSAVTMFFVLDIGIANTLSNLISEAYAKDDKRLAGSYLATAFWLVVGISILIGIAGLSCWPFMNWQFLFHLNSPALVQETSQAVAAAFIVFLCALPAGLAAKVLAGYQEVHVANLFAMSGSLVSLAALIAVIRLHGSLAVLVVAFAGSVAAANAICLLWVCFIHKPWLTLRPGRYQKQLMGKIFHSGGQFFVIQLAGLVVLNSDNLIISHYLSPSQVTPYNVTWRIVSYITAVPILMFPALWPAYSEAYARGDLAWIRSTYARTRWISLAALSAGCFVLLLGGQSIIRIWAGPSAVPTPTLLRLMCVWMFIYAITLNQSCLMGATSRVKKQAIYSALSAFANLALTIVWVKSMGVTGVLLGTIVSYLLFIVVAQTLEVRHILSGKAVQSV